MGIQQTRVFGQVKFKSTGDRTAEKAVRPIGLFRDMAPLEGPLPHLALILELGNDSKYQKTRSYLKVSIPEFDDATEFAIRKHDWEVAVKAIEEYKGKNPGVRLRNDSKLVKDMKNKRMKMDCCNRFGISIRGTSCYGILNKLEIAKQFKSLLNITMPSPTEQDETIQHMRPLERLGSESGHTAWMSKYEVEREECLMDVDA